LSGGVGAGEGSHGNGEDIGELDVANWAIRDELAGFENM
jgi:hypothetical protein